MSAPLDRIDAPPVSPTRFGLTSVALVLDAGDGHWLNGVTYAPDPLVLADGQIVSTDTDDTAVTATRTARKVDLGTTLTWPGGFTVDWGDGASTHYASTAALDAGTHTYAADGTYDVTITADRGSWTASGSVQVKADGTANGDVTLAGTQVKGSLTGLPDEVTGDVFPIIARWICRQVGLAPQEEADRLLALMSPAAIETRFARVTLPAVPGAEDVTGPDGPYTPVEGLAVLERVLGERYAGQGTILTERDVATIAGSGGGLSRNSGRLETTLGTPLGTLSPVGGGGIAGPSGSSLPAGASWAWATGPIVVRLSTRTSVVTQQDQASGGYTNEVAAFAERFALATVDQVAYAVQVWRDSRPSTRGA